MPIRLTFYRAWIRSRELFRDKSLEISTAALCESQCARGRARHSSSRSINNLSPTVNFGQREINNAAFYMWPRTKSYFLQTFLQPLPGYVAESGRLPFSVNWHIPFDSDARVGNLANDDIYRFFSWYFQRFLVFHDTFRVPAQKPRWSDPQITKRRRSFQVILMFPHEMKIEIQSKNNLSLEVHLEIEVLNFQ